MLNPMKNNNKILFLFQREWQKLINWLINESVNCVQTRSFLTLSDAKINPDVALNNAHRWFDSRAISAKFAQNSHGDMLL